MPTLYLLCDLYVPTVCGLFAYCVLSFYLRFGTKKKAYSLYSSQEPFIHYLLCSAPCCRKTRADVGIKYLPTNQFVFRLFSSLKKKNSKSCSKPCERCSKGLCSLLNSRHMGQFLQGGNFGCFVSFFFLKVELSCD